MNILFSGFILGELWPSTYDLEIGQGIGWSSGCDKIDGIIYSVRISKVIRTKDEIWTNYMKVGHLTKKIIMRANFVHRTKIAQT